MAKDGTARGGKRANAGAKPKQCKIKMTEKDTPISVDVDRLDKKQQCGQELCIKQIRDELMQYLGKFGCENLVMPHLIEQYVMNYARWAQCENIISEKGFIGAHPTTGLEMKSPYVDISGQYLKQANIAWNNIYSIVKENAQIKSESDSIDPMERLLKSV
jgi:hypothetical protein